MRNETRINNNIFNSEQQPLFTEENTAYTVKTSSFGILTAGMPVWTPSPQKSINLTAVQFSAPLDVTITLSLSGGSTLLSERLTQGFASASLRFPSPCRLTAGAAIFAATSDETTDCDAFGAATAAQAAYNGRSDFTNVSNAAGLPNGQYATLNSALLISTGGRIVLSYGITLPSISRMQIESVVLKFYCRLALTLAVGTSSMIFYWRPTSGDAWIQLQQLSLSVIGTLNYLTTPLVQDITSAVLASSNPWSVLSTLQTSFVGVHTGLGVGNTIQLDAVEIDICLSGINEVTLFGFES